MTFADIYLITYNINVLGLNFKMTDCYDTVIPCADRFLNPGSTNIGGKVNTELHIDWSTPTPAASPTTILLFQSRTQKKFYFAFII